MFVCETGREEETITRLSRVGFDNTLGYLNGGIRSWIKSGRQTDSVNSIDSKQIVDIDLTKDKIIDVRKNNEFNTSHVEVAINISLSSLNESFQNFLDKKDKYIHCQGGYRSMIACSILKSRGVHNIINIRGGFKKISESKLIPII